MKKNEWLEASVVYQDIFRTGELSVARLMLENRFGRLSRKAQSQLEGLTLTQIDELALAIWQFKTKSELNDWLARHAASR